MTSWSLTGCYVSASMRSAGNARSQDRQDCMTEIGEGLHHTLTDQARQVWSVLTASTKPAHTVDAHGKPPTGYRSGNAARDMVRQTGMRLGLTGLHRFQLR